MANDAQPLRAKLRAARTDGDLYDSGNLVHANGWGLPWDPLVTPLTS